MIVQPSSTVPVVGASGAIAGVMGAYLVWFPWVRVRTIIVLGVFPLWPRIPAAPILLVWFASQFLIGNDSAIAWMAHVAGFVFGIIAGLIARSDSGHADWRKGNRPQERQVPGGKRDRTLGPPRARSQRS